MKRTLTILPFFLPLALISLAFGTVIIWKPTDLDAALIWNLTIILAPVFALIAQWHLSRERQLPMVLTLTVGAILNTAIVLGSRLGAWDGADWLCALTGNGLPDLPGKTVMGGLVLMLLVYFILKRWWRLPSGLADVLMLGLPLAAVLGRVGCLVAGCCYGIPTDANWGISYGPGTPAYSHQVQLGLIADGASGTSLLFPVQLFFIAGNLFIFAFLWQFRKKLARPGAIALLGFALLTFQRFGLEFMRDVATNRGGFGIIWEGLKVSQWVSLLIATASMTGFLVVQFFQTKKIRANTSRIPIAGTATQAYVLGTITIGSFLLRDLLTFDEAMVIFVSCTPSVLLLGRQLWREHHTGKPMWVPASMLSATAFVLVFHPVDTIAPEPKPIEWKQWTEVGAGGSFGSYKKIVRDCSGNVVREDIIKTNSGGGEISSNWEKGWTKLQISLRGTFGTAHTDDNKDKDSNYNYSSFGVVGGVSLEWFGLSSGLFSRYRKFPARLGLSRSSQSVIYPSVSVRIGPLDRFFLDARVYDEPLLGFSNEPVFSSGFNWGFNDRTGNSRLRVGFAINGVGDHYIPEDMAFHLAGQFPLGDSGLSGGFAGYLGHTNMLSMGLKYRFKEK